VILADKEGRLPGSQDAHARGDSLYLESARQVRTGIEGYDCPATKLVMAEMT